MQLHRDYVTARSGITKDGTRLYRSSKRDCDIPPLNADEFATQLRGDVEDQ